MGVVVRMWGSSGLAPVLPWRVVAGEPRIRAGLEMWPVDPTTGWVAIDREGRGDAWRSTWCTSRRKPSSHWSAVVAFWAVSLMFVLTPGADWAYAIAAGLRHRTVVPAGCLGTRRTAELSTSDCIGLQRRRSA